ncbi:MAG: hypothetical protein KC501_35090 [Myxococcales bacterium]|nr:hypothetical protein [Myxococcales bacterium]
MTHARISILLVFALSACNGGGESTTVAMTSADDTGPGDSTGVATTDAPTTDEPTTDTPTTDAPTTGDTDSADTTGDDTGGTTAGVCDDVGIEGNWLSEGENVAQLLVDVLDIVSITATFTETTFDVNSTDGSGAMVQQTGTYAVEPCPGSDTKFSIILEQTAPQAITVEGIYEIDGCQDPAVMTYEVIQTQPDVGAVPPTCDDDFGTGAFGQDNVQIFVRQP